MTRLTNMKNLTTLFHATALACVLTFTAATPALAHEDGWFKGKYVIGDGERKITATPKDGSPLVNVRFEGEAKPRIYSAEGTEKETEYLETDTSGKVKTKFIFGNTAATGVFVDENGKKEKVSRGK